MRFRFALLLCVAVPFSGEASSIATDEANHRAYALSVFASPTSVRCASLLPNYRREFDQAFSEWKAKNREPIEAGRAVAISKLKPGEDIDSNERRLAGTLGAAFVMFSPEQLKQRCSALLTQLREVASAPVASDAGACEVPEKAKEISLSLDGDIETFRATVKKRESSLEAEIAAEATSLTTDGLLTEHQRMAFFQSLPTSREFADLEHDKGAHLKTYMDHARGAAQNIQAKNYQDTCKHAVSMLAELKEISELNVRQYAFMLTSLRAIRNPAK
jgi:hypothetical protein